MALSEIDRSLLSRCLQRESGAWEDFVDRFLGLVIHVVDHTARGRSMALSPQDRDDLCSEVFLVLVREDFAVLRHFRGNSSLATYLSVIARRVVVRQLQKRRNGATVSPPPEATHVNGNGKGFEERITDRDEVERLLSLLDENEAQIVRLYHLEGKTYQEISTTAGIAENSVGPLLSRAREKMRRAAT